MERGVQGNALGTPHCSSATTDAAAVKERTLRPACGAARPGRVVAAFDSAALPRDRRAGPGYAGLSV